MVTKNGKEIICKQCGKKKYLRMSKIKRSKNHFCSHKCYSKFEKTGIDITCPICGTIKYISGCHLKRTNSNFCSAKCYHASKKNGKIIICNECGKEKYKSKTSLRRSNIDFCSKKCREIDFLRIQNNKKNNTKKKFKQICESKEIQIIGNYENTRKHIKLKCLKCNKEWLCSAGTLLGENRRCPNCIEYLTENKTRNIFEDLFNFKFIKVRKWNKIIPNVRFLELDGHNEELKIAFEYNGRQHYELCHYNNYDINTLNLIKKRDRLKKILAKKEGITLITIPYSIKNIRLYIVNWLKKVRILPMEFIV